jgi:hypothetical protein
MNGERSMGLVVLAQVIRDLVADGEYIVECIEQREYGKVAVSLALRSRAQPYNIQIETTDSKLEGLFRALLGDKETRSEKSRLAKLGAQAVPSVEVASLPADAPKRRRRRQAALNHANGTQPAEPTGPTVRRRRSARQLVLMPQEAASTAHQATVQTKRGRPSKVREQAERP